MIAEEFSQVFLTLLVRIARGLSTLCTNSACLLHDDIIEQAQLRVEADRLGCLRSTDVWTWNNQLHGDSIQS